MNRAHHLAVLSTLIATQVSGGGAAQAQGDVQGISPASIASDSASGKSLGTRDRLLQILVDDGFANVAVLIDDRRVAVSYENARYRDPRLALRRVAELLRPALTDGEELVLVPTIAAVPILSARFVNKQAPGGHLDFMPWAVSLDLSDVPPELLRTTRSSSSFGRIDVVLHPWFEASFGDFSNPVASRTGVAPEIRVALRPGLTVSAQALFTIQDDLPTGESRVRPGLVAVSQTMRLPRNVFVSASAGTFTPNHYGMDVEAAVYSANSRWSVGTEVGLTGATWFGSGDWSLSPLRERTALVTIAGRMPRYGVTVRGTAGVFLGAERGARLDVSRRFGEFELGWFGAAVEEGANGGFTLRIPLPQRRYAMPAPVRIRAAEWFRWQYRYHSSLAGRPYNKGSAADDVIRGFEVDLIGR